MMGDTIYASALIADDSPAERRLLREAIGGECNRVIEAADWAEAVELSRRYVPDLIVLDLQVGGGDALAKIRADSELADVPIICLAGPVEPLDLRARVRAALHQRG